MPITNVTCIWEGYTMFETDDGMMRYWNDTTPITSHRIGDKAGSREMMAKLRVVNEVPQDSLALAFGVHRNTVVNAANKFREFGSAIFYQPRKERSCSAISPKQVKEGERLLAQGMNQSQAAEKLGVARSTFNAWVRKGKIRLPGRAVERNGESEVEGGKVTERSERDGNDKRTPMGRATHDIEGRQAAANGKIDEANPVFDTAHNGVANGGVLTALPTLLEEGLLDRVNTGWQLSKGYYGLRTILLLVAMMTLGRIRNPEKMRYESPGEWGKVLGLDRCPEVKTLRGKIREIAEDERQIQEWRMGLSTGWMEEAKENQLTVDIDGHVKNYTGRKGNLPKHYSARNRLCLPASVGYWLNVLGGKPLMCLHKSVDPKMVDMIEREIVPELKKSGILPEAPHDLTVGSDSKDPSATLVFDREGWSPRLFKNLAKEGIAVITWYKDCKEEKWPIEEFASVEIPIHGPAETWSRTIRLAERNVRLSNGLPVRMLRLLDDDRQVPMVTTNGTMTTNEVAGSLLSRWAQENFFKYMRDEFNLDALTSHDLEPMDPETRVVNPSMRELKKDIKKKRKILEKRRSDAFRDHGTRDSTDALESELEELKELARSTPTHVKAGELDEPLDALPDGQRVFFDIIKMICYRAETAMMPPLMSAQGKKRNSRKLLQALFTSDANVIPDHGKGILKVQILGLAANCMDEAVECLLDELNKTETRYPGTELKMVYEVA